MGHLEWWSTGKLNRARLEKKIRAKIYVENGTEDLTIGWSKAKTSKVAGIKSLVATLTLSAPHFRTTDFRLIANWCKWRIERMGKK